MFFARHYARLQAIVDSPRGKRRLHLAARAIWVGVVGLLVYQLSRIGWRDLGRSIPTTPWFYALFFLYYAALPVFELASYRRIWRFDFWRTLPPFFQKHVYNQDVIDYSGEIYLYVWLKRRLAIADGELLRTIKDNSVLSILAGYTATLALPPLFWACGLLGGARPLSGRQLAVVCGLAPALLVALLGIMVLVRRRVFFLQASRLGELFGWNLGRILVMNGITLAQWSVVMPDQPLRVWCTLLAMTNLVQRLPSLFRADLIVVAVGVQLSAGLEVPSAALAGMLLANSVLEKVTNASVFLATTLLTGRERAPADVVAAQDVEVAAARDRAA